MESKRGVSPVLGVVLLILITIVLASIVAYYVIPTANRPDSSCIEALNGISFDDVGFSCTLPDSPQKLSGFSVRIINSDIEGFQVGFSDKASADTYQVLEGKSYPLLCSLGKKFGEPLEFPDTGAVRTYVAKGNFDKMFISPVLKNGETCYSEARREVPLDVQCVSSNVINRFRECNTGSNSCGNSIVETELGEECDPPGPSSSCTSGTCGGNCICTPLPLRCEFTGEPSWSVTTAYEGDVVTMTAPTNGQCDGQSGVFDIYEDDIFSNINAAGPISGNFAGNLFNAQWTTQWVNDGFTPFNTNPPEYFFRATINSGPSQGEFIESPTDPNFELKVNACGDENVQNPPEECDGDVGGQTCSSVFGPNWIGTLACNPRGSSNQCRFTGCTQQNPLFCGDNICNNGETCSTCSQDCGVCPGPICGNNIIEPPEECDPPGSQQTCEIGPGDANQTGGVRTCDNLCQWGECLGS